MQAKLKFQGSLQTSCSISINEDSIDDFLRAFTVVFYGSLKL